MTCRHALILTILYDTMQLYQQNNDLCSAYPTYQHSVSSALVLLAWGHEENECRLWHMNSASHSTSSQRAMCCAQVSYLHLCQLTAMFWRTEPVGTPRVEGGANFFCRQGTMKAVPPTSHWIPVGVTEVQYCRASACGNSLSWLPLPSRSWAVLK